MYRQEQSPPIHHLHPPCTHSASNLRRQRYVLVDRDVPSRHVVRSSLASVPVPMLAGSVDDVEHFLHLLGHQLAEVPGERCVVRRDDRVEATQV